MLTFSDLIKKGVAPSPYKTNVIGPENSDRFIINYNNIWGIISDTHMSKGEDGNYYITGQLFRNKANTERFIYSSTWGGYCFKDSSLKCACLFDYCRSNYKTIEHTIVNGDDVLVLKDFTEEQKEYYDKYFGVNAEIGNEICADVQKRKKDAIKNADIARSLNFVY